MEAASTPNPTTPSSSDLFRTLFVYGPMMAEEVVVALLGRSPARRPATLSGYARCCKKGAEQRDGVCSTHRSLVAATYPAVIETGNPAHEVEGIILERLRPQEIRCLDYFEDESYQKIPVQVVTENGFGGRTPIDCLVYSYPSTQMAASLLDPSKPWGYKEFRQHHLASFVESIVKPAKARFEKEEGELEVIHTERNGQMSARSRGT